MSVQFKLTTGSKGFPIVKESAADVVNVINERTKLEGETAYLKLVLESGATVHVSGITGRNPRRRANRLSQTLKKAGDPVVTGAIVTQKNKRADAVHVRGMLADDAVGAILASR